MLLEIVASTVEDCVAAESGGADRVELCAAIEVGGLTPPIETLLEAKRRVKIPVMTMVRPRDRDFCYSVEDFEVMCRDAARLVKSGADGIVFGILLPDGNVDIRRCAQLSGLAKGGQTVFHRAFDAAADPTRALHELIDLEFTRVLTSGQQPTALEGRGLIRELIGLAGGRIEVLPGGKVRAHNARQLVEATGCTQVHMTAFAGGEAAATSHDTPSGIFSKQVDQRIVFEMRQVLDGIVRAKSSSSIGPKHGIEQL